MDYLKKFLYTAFTILFFFITLFAYTKLVGPIPFNIDSVVTTQSDIFTVTGEGKATVEQGNALVTLGVSTTGSSARVAQNDLNEKINQVIAAIKELGIPDSDIKTQNYNVNPNYDYSSPTARITNYSASTMLTITVKDLEKVNGLVDTSTANGANQIGGVTFESEDSKKSEEEARKKAVEDAKAQAIQAAKIAGFKLGRLVNYSENSKPPIMPYESLRTELPGIGGGSDIQPGLNEVIVVVTLSYEID